VVTVIADLVESEDANEDAVVAAAVVDVMAVAAAVHVLVIKDKVKAPAAPLCLAPSK
jgi:hypothetical protein